MIMTNTPAHPIRILIAEDESSLRTILKKLFLKKGYEVETVPDGEMAIAKIRQQNFQIALLDINMPNRSGLEVLSIAKQEHPQLSVIMITAQDTMKNAVEAMKRGAFDYVSKPFELEEIELLVERALETHRLTREVEQLKKELSARSYDAQAKIIGKSKPIKEIYKLIGKVAASDVPVLITGESGTGKELIARAIHQSSNRVGRPFVAVNCAAIPRELLESELFGTKKGAYTGAEESRAGYFEAANKGTLFLDEIGDMPYGLQSKLLRVLQEKEISRLGSTETKPIDVRIISATNQDLSQLTSQKKFREDLYFRLNVVPIRLPPLRERSEDLEVLVEHFLGKFEQEFSLPHKKIASDVFHLLQTYSWPGNVRELENVIKRALVLSHGNLIQKKDIQSILQENPQVLGQSEIESLSLEELIRNKLKHFLDKFDQMDAMDLYQTIIQMVEKPLVTLVLQKTKWNQIQAAKVLGINRNTLRKMIRTLKIPILKTPEGDE